MDREPYDYQTERRIAAYALTALIVFLAVADAASIEFSVDPFILVTLVGALFGMVGLGALLRRLDR